MSEHPAARLWIGYWRMMMRYHRYEVEGLEHLDSGGPYLVVGYHGRPIAHAMCMFTVAVWERLGYIPHGVMHAGFEKNRALNWITEGIGFVYPGAAMDRVVEAGEHLVTLPGGTREGCRSVLSRHQVDWGRRTGYLRFALRHGLSIVPVGSHEDLTYIGLNDGYELGKRLGVPHGVPVWFGLGPLGLWPLSPPFPTRIRQRVGPPIELPAVDAEDRGALLELHDHITSAVQSLVDGACRG